MITNSVFDQRIPESLRALDALAKITSLTDAALYLTANDNEKSVQSDLLGIIYDIAFAFKEGSEK